MFERKLPIGIQSFEEIRKNNYVYVDKTEYIWKVINSGKAYFLSRPRRFGKSLLMATFEAYFHGKKDLFQGLAIEKLENEKKSAAWEKYPVIHIDFTGGDYNAPEGLNQKLDMILSRYEQEFHLKNRSAGNLGLSNRFELLIDDIYRSTGKQVVVLVDEYDKPLLDTMEVSTVQEEKNRRIFKTFFNVLKGKDAYLKFVFFTGITRFSKVSIFSDLNQLNDISMDDRYSGICGITEKELQQNFQPEIKNMAKANDQTMKECEAALARMYDGYHFSKKGEGIYNPFSILNAFDKRDYGRFWFSTGTPTFLIHRLRKSSFSAEQFSNGVEASEMELTDYGVDNSNPIPLFYQSGYLTIADFDREFRIYTLRFPNEEVKFGFLNSLMPIVLGDQEADNPIPLRNMVIDLRKGKIDDFMECLRVLFAGIPYVEGSKHLYEQEWRNEIYLILALLGQNVSCEVHSAKGRADCVAEVQNYVYIFEFKLDKSAEEALNQIEEKGYADAYGKDSRTVCKIGVNFSSEERNIEKWKMVS